MAWRNVAPPNEMPATKFSDLNMLVAPGGRERTRDEYAALFKQSPVGLAYTAGLDAPTAKVLQEAAWATVQDYFRK